MAKLNIDSYVLGPNWLLASLFSDSNQVQYVSGTDTCAEPDWSLL